MGKRKRIGCEKVDLSDIQIRQDDYIGEYDPDDDNLGGFSLEELEELGAISYPETRKTIPDGESEFYIAFKQGEDF
jgi:hypothetical protein